MKTLVLVPFLVALSTSATAQNFFPQYATGPDWQPTYDTYTPSGLYAPPIRQQFNQGPGWSYQSQEFSNGLSFGSGQIGDKQIHCSGLKMGHMTLNNCY